MSYETDSDLDGIDAREQVTKVFAGADDGRGLFDGAPASFTSRHGARNAMSKPKTVKPQRLTFRQPAGVFVGMITKAVHDLGTGDAESVMTTVKTRARNLYSAEQVAGVHGLNLIAHEEKDRSASIRNKQRMGQERGVKTKRIKRDLDDAAIADRIRRLLVDNDTEAATSRRKLVETLGDVDHREVKRVCDAHGWLMPRRKA